MPYEVKPEARSAGEWWRVESHGVPVFIGTLEACAEWIREREDRREAG